VGSPAERVDGPAGEVPLRSMDSSDPDRRPRGLSAGVKGLNADGDGVFLYGLVGNSQPHLPCHGFRQSHSRSAYVQRSKPSSPWTVISVLLRRFFPPHPGDTVFSGPDGPGIHRNLPSPGRSSPGCRARGGCSRRRRWILGISPKSPGAVDGPGESPASGDRGGGWECRRAHGGGPTPPGRT